MEEPLHRLRRTVAPGQSLAERFPDIAKQWDFEKNGDIRPSTISFGSGFVAYWIHGGGCGEPGCDEVHRWKAPIHSRTNGTGCPKCRGVREFCPCKSLARRFPEIAAQWDYERNELTPSQVSFGQNMVAWWIHQGGCRRPDCTEVHRWKASIYKRVRGGGCLPCSTGGTGKHFCPCRSLARRFPEIAEEWDYDKNGDDIHPEDVLPGSHKEVHWKHPCPNPGCSDVHEWKAAINNRALHGSGCPKCSSGGTGEDFCPCRSLAMQYPAIAAEWDFERNGDQTPELFLPGAVMNVFWIHWGGCGEPGCAEVHRWEASIHNRVSGSGCSLCRGSSSGFCPCRSLARRYPEISAEWHPTKNGASKPEDFSYGCGDKVWWLCPKGHEWDASIRSRTSGSGCRSCNTNKAEKRLRELAGEHMDIMDFFKGYINMDVPGVPGRTRNLEPDAILTHRDGRKAMVELDGPHHFRSFYYGGGQSTDIEDWLAKDRVKNMWAANKGYSILRVSYLEYNRLDSIFLQFMEDWSRTERVIQCTNEELYNSQGDTWKVLDGL